MDDAPPPTPERTLRAAALSGDVDGWRRLFEPAFDPVHRYARWRCGGRADLTDDVVQEAWLTAARKLRAFDPDAGRFAGWVCGIVATVARAHVRRRLRTAARVRPLVAVAEPVHPEADAAADPELVARALAGLPARYEAALRMKYFDRLTVADMTAATGDTVKAVESLLARAREAFREAYRRLGGDTP